MIAQIDKEYIRTRYWKLWSRLLSYALFEGRPLTTRGQWINPVVFAHFAIEKRLPALRAVKKPIFILGTGRSGTTILGIVLSMHREVGFLNEPKALWHAIHPGEDLIGSYSREPARYRLDAEDANTQIIKTAHRLFGAYLAASFSRRVVDKYPELIFRVPFVQSIFPDAKFLFLIRNGWDTCRSIKLWSDRLGQQQNEETHDWWGADMRKWRLLVDQIVPEHKDLAPHAEQMRGWTDHTDMAALEWIVSMREGLRLEKQKKYAIMNIHYEKLCNEPRKTMEEIMDFAELEKDGIFTDYAESVLSPIESKLPFKLASPLVLPFHETMCALGYEEQA